MKRSYFVSPRTLGECSFYTSCDPIERPVRRAPVATTALFVFLAVVLIAATIVGAV
jgi:hypothetical protein